ncbi:MAG: hypothetical protein AAF585_13510 [Verrucomicrobiota bacterium]
MKTQISIIIASVAFLFASAAAGAPKPYPIKDCLVSDNKLGSMGKVIRIVHEKQEVKFCCKPCVKKFKANPEKYLAKIKK